MPRAVLGAPPARGGLMRFPALTAALLTLLGMARIAEGGSGPGEPDLFTSKVRPILARHCFKCHGPDEKTRKARLRLDVREEALRPAASGFRPIVPGNLEESELVGRIDSEDES